jgi:hypothetical protein
MDKKTLKQEIIKILKKEISATGTGASVTPGVGAGVATKYAFGKRNNKGTPKDWKPAPSIPNRKSKTMDYKELWELDVNNTNTDEILTYLQAAKQNGTLSPDAQEVFIQWMNTPGASREEIIKVLRNLTGMYLKEESNQDFLQPGNRPIITDKNNNKFILQGFIKDGYYLIPYNGEKYWEHFFIPKDQWIPEKNINWENYNFSKAQFDKLKAKHSDTEQNILAKYQNSINEGYAQFKNSTKTRTKPEQYHSAVKEVKKKVNEINRLFEYMDRLKSELNEGEEIKYKKYTEKAIQQIKESTKSLFFKSTKLK